MELLTVIVTTILFVIGMIGIVVTWDDYEKHRITLKGFYVRTFFYLLYTACVVFLGLT